MKGLTTLVLVGFIVVAIWYGLRCIVAVGAHALSERWSSLTYRIHVRIFAAVVFFIAVAVCIWSFGLTSGVLWSAACLAVGTWVACWSLENERDRETTRQRLDEYERFRQDRLATGVGWGKFDVLAKYRTTLYFRNEYGRLQTTQGWRCASCGRNLYSPSDATLDHIKPRSRHPHLIDTESNLQVLCRHCNSTKSAYDGDDWKSVLRKRRRVIRKRERNSRRKPGRQDDVNE